MPQDNTDTALKDAENPCGGSDNSEAGMMSQKMSYSGGKEHDGGVDPNAFDESSQQNQQPDASKSAVVTPFVAALTPPDMPPRRKRSSLNEEENSDDASTGGKPGEMGGSSNSIANGQDKENISAAANSQSLSDLELGNSVSLTYLKDERKEESESSAKRPRVGSGEQDVEMEDVNNDEEQVQSDDDDWSKISAGSILSEKFSFDSSDDEESVAEGGKRRVGDQLTKRFDINFLVSSIERGEAALEKLVGRDVVVVVGKTGTGKSTLIQCIAGRQLRETTHSCKSRYGGVAEKIVFEAAQDALPGFEIGHAKTSRTAHINCYDPNKEGKKSHLVYVDCPGFEDTNGHEADVATSVMLSKVASKCKSLRFVILISYVSLLEDRGGAMRSVLKLIRSFSRNFGEERKSFMFLFTHTNEIQGVPDSIEGASACVRDEIVRIIDGTTDEETLGVLKVIERSLRKKYPFATVFLPLKTNAQRLVGAIYKYLAPVESSHLAGNCGLTQSSRLTLSGELHYSLQLLRHELHSENPNMDNVIDLLKLFRCVEQYILIEDVNNVADEVRSQIENFIKRQKSSINDEVKRGTFSEHKFGLAHASTIKVALHCLKSLQHDYRDKIDFDRISCFIQDEVLKFQEAVKRPSGQSYYGIHHQFSKLKVWADAFPDFAPLYRSSLDHLGQVIDKIVSRIKDIDTSHLVLLSEERLENFLCDINVLHSISDDAENLSKYFHGADSAVQAYSSAASDIQLAISSWRTPPLSEVKAAIVDDHQLQNLIKITRCVEGLLRLFETYSFSPKLRSEVAKTRQILVNNTTECFEELCSELGEDFSYSPIFESGLMKLRTASDLFGENGDVWKRIVAIFDSFIERIKSAVRAKSGEVDEMSQSAMKNGVRDGKREAKMLKDFDSLRWFDDFIPLKDRFVANCSIKFERIYEDRVSHVTKESSEFLRQIKDDAYESSLAASSLKLLLMEMGEISQLASVLKKGLSTMETDMRKNITNHIMALGRTINGDIIDWNIAINENMQNGVCIAAERLEHGLCEISALYGLDDKCDATLKSARLDIEKACDFLTQVITSSLEIKGHYEKKAEYLHLIEKLGKYSNIASLLPTSEKFKSMVRDTIALDAKEIEDRVSQTAEWDQIDHLLTQFEEATILDKFTSNEASSRLRPLMQLREQKEAQVDDLLDGLIRDQDFEGIKEFIVPFADSSDQIKRQKFNQWCSKIASSLSTTVREINQDLDRVVSEEMCHSITNHLNVLEQAKTELSPQLIKLPGGLILEEEVKSVKKKIRQILDELIIIFDKYFTRMNFEGMGTSYRSIEILSTYMGAHLTHRNKKRVDDSQKKFGRAKESVTDSIDRFVQSAFQDDARLHQSLPSLKNVFESDNLDLPNLSKLYETSRKELTEKINQAFNICNDTVSQSNCYYQPIEMLTALDRQLRKGLKDHLSESELSFDCEAKLQEWRDEQRKIDHEMDFDGSNAEEKLKSWASLMNGLDPESGGYFSGMSRFFVRMKSGTTYEMKREELHTKIIDRYTRGMKALKDSDYRMLQECIHILDLTDRHIGKHIPFASTKSRALKKNASSSFLGICKEAQSILGSDNRNQLQRIFPDYQDSVVYLPFIMTSSEVKKAFKLTNQLMHDALEEDISEIKEHFEAFDFAKLRTKVQSTREFGGFLADHCLLLHERIRTSEHLEVDQWLDAIFELCSEHFSQFHNLSHLKYFAILEIPSSSDQNAVKKAYKSLAKRYHPDKTGGNDGTMFRKIKEAHDHLLDNVDFSRRDSADLPFGSLIRGARTMLREKAKVLMEEQRYDVVETLLFRLNDLKMLDNLVTPRLNHNEIIDEIKELIRGYVEQVRIDVDSNWSSRKYGALNENITDLKSMEMNFKAYPAIFSSSWNNGIVQTVEKEIEELGQQARSYLRSQHTAKQNCEDFRRCFLNMGHVLVELPLFKSATKAVMCGVLESCLAHDWGYSFLFEFGLGLQRGDESNSEVDNQVAQLIVSEFSHFKEVLTMVWNEETSQKPADDTVHSIKGQHRSGKRMKELKIERSQLLECFTEFDCQYKKLLGEYIDPNADMKALVQKTAAIANKLEPLDCDSGWNKKVKERIPHILAGVFAVFTIRKSGDSYNRLSDSDTSEISAKLLMKPHNIQVLTLLALFGCGSPSSSSLDSQLMQIRTGEGKSMILGAAAVVLALLGFKARCVCYSEYLSDRDYALFRDVFDDFDVSNYVKYSKITTLSEDTTKAKGDIRTLTEGLLRGELEAVASASTIKTDQTDLPPGTCSVGITTRSRSGAKAGERPMESDVISQTGLETPPSGSRSSRRLKKKKEVDETTKITKNPQPTDIQPLARKEILLVDEVDVFFGAEFYGQTYNQVAQLREPEIADILNHIWIANKRGGRRQRLADIQALPAYSQLLNKIDGFKYVLDSEIALMIDQVRRVDEEPYHLDRDTDRIGYKVMDSISYEVTYGYRTVFAYLQEAEKGNLRDKNSALASALFIPLSCGQFSYANISPERILGVSGTLSALGEYENDVLSKYGVNTFMYVPSVYGESNFHFDKAGDGIRIETSVSDYYHSITDQIQLMVKQKRSVIVFFQDNSRLKDFTNSSFYRKLGRKKKLLTEKMSKSDKEFVISKAATAGQVTISTAVFGRGTDFFCKDETVQRNGGVHVIQAFLSEEESEEIQIQGRTARQGKKGSYQMILLDSDLEKQFGLVSGWKEKNAKGDWYNCLSAARKKRRESIHNKIDANLADATEKDRDTHRYFDALLANDMQEASKSFKDIYASFKKGSMPSSIELDIAFLIDITGSMAPYAQSATATIKNMLSGPGSIVSKLNIKFPEIEFHLRVGVMGFRDIDDGSQQFVENGSNGGCHFFKNPSNSVGFVDTILKSPSGGGDIAEDILGAIDRSAKWNTSDDWTSPIKFMLLFTDAPGHGLVPKGSANIPNVDGYSVRHPCGLTPEKVADSLVTSDIDLFFCSFNPAATSRTEEELSIKYLEHKDNSEQREITSIVMVPENQSQHAEVLGGNGKHIIFVLDQSGSMAHNWNGVVIAYNQYISRRHQNQSDCDLVSVVQFNDIANTTVSMKPIAQAPIRLGYRGGGTLFSPAAQNASQLAISTPTSHVPVIVFMSDGCAHDAIEAANTFSQLNCNLRRRIESELELNVIAFGTGASHSQLQQIARSSQNGKLHMSADTAELSNIFVQIAGGSEVADVLEAQIGKRISEAVSDRLALEYVR